MECRKCSRDLPADAVYCCYCGRRLSGGPRKAAKRPNGAGSVYKLSGRRARPWAASRKGVWLGTYETKAAALEALERSARRPISDAINLTMEQIWERWKAEKFPGLAEKSQEVYLTTWPIFSGLAGEKMRTLRTEDVQRLVDEQVQKGRSRSQCEKIRNLYSQLCKWAMREDIIDRNYAEFLRLPRGKKPQRDTFTAKELALLQQDAETCDTSKLILMLIFTGFRLNELLLLPMSGVNLEADTLTGGEKTEAGRDRVVPIHPAIRPYVAYFAGKAKGDLLISGYEGNRDQKNFRSRDYYPTLRRLGISTAERPMKPHSCWYTFATMAVSADLQPEALQKIMGHAQYSTTANIYDQGDLQRIQQEMGKLPGIDRKLLETDAE